MHGREITAELQTQLEEIRDEVEQLREEIRTPDPELLTTDDAASILGVSERTVSTLIADGELRSIKVRRCRRIPRGAIEDYIDRSVERPGGSR